VIHPTEFAELSARVDSIERDVRAHRNEDVASKCSLLRAYIASHHDDSLKAGMLGLLTDLERRLRPLSLALEMADLRRVAQSLQLDDVAPPHP